uniref:Uncharacterized protein n=1 Tax=Knipowitschia caucasica TaxID=637954 RepID=A0AAV2JMN5_KNICA
MGTPPLEECTCGACVKFQPQITKTFVCFQAQKLKSNSTVDGIFCDPQIDGPSSSNSISRSSSTPPQASTSSLLPLLVWLWVCMADRQF